MERGSFRISIQRQRKARSVDQKPTGDRLWRSAGALRSQTKAHGQVKIRRLIV